MRFKTADQNATRKRELDYLLAQESEERGERRGLEQRAAGLVGALLIAFPVSAAVARKADTRDTITIIALGLLVLVLFAAVLQARALTSALGEPKRERNKVRDARVRVAEALRTGDLTSAVTQQRTIVETIRVDNGTLVRKVRRITAQLPVTLAGLLAALTVLVLAGRPAPAPVTHVTVRVPSR